MPKSLLSYFILPIFCISFYCEGQTNDVLGHGFDVRTIDAVNWERTASKRPFVGGNFTEQNIVDSTQGNQYHFVTSAYDFEQKVTATDQSQRPFSASASNSFFAPLKQPERTNLLFVYLDRRVPKYRRKLVQYDIATIDSTLILDFARLGRDITPEGFISRYGTHFAAEVVYGGRFLRRNMIPIENYIYSPYDKETFHDKVIEDLQATYYQKDDPNPYIQTEIGTNYTRGGNPLLPSPHEWEQTLTNNTVPINVVLIPYTELFYSIQLTGIENMVAKLQLLDSVTQNAIADAQKELGTPITTQYFKKYSLRFKQSMVSIVKKTMGLEVTEDAAYVGDLFFGGFSKDDAILKTEPLIDYGGIRLERLITDEKVMIDKQLIYTVNPADFEAGYVSVWDDSKKLFKSAERTALRYAGTPEAKTKFKEALVGKVSKTIAIETINDDVYEVNYEFEVIKESKILQNRYGSYDYSLSTQFVAAAATGNLDLLKELFSKQANTNNAEIIKAIIENKQSNEILNYVIDKGVQPTTADLDLAFEREFFDTQKVLILLERGARPKNNMIFKAVAYNASDVIYALFREGATPRNNDLSFALQKYHYPTIKALMSEVFKEFEAGKNELLLAAENNDAALANKFIALGATSDAYILEKAVANDNPVLKEAIASVIEADNDALLVAATIDDTQLFDRFIAKGARVTNDTISKIAIANKNLSILSQTVKNGGNPNIALQEAIDKEFKAALLLTLDNGANADPVFAYAAAKKDDDLFNQALIKYNGTPNRGLQEAIRADRIELAESVLKTNSEGINPSLGFEKAIENNNPAMVSLLLENDANATEGVREAIRQDNTSITELLIQQGAETSDPALLTTAITAKNLAITKILVEKGNTNLDMGMDAATVSANQEITKYLISKGAQTDAALDNAIQTKNEEIILMLLAETTALKPSFISASARLGNNKVISKLLTMGMNPNEGLTDALRYKQYEVIETLVNAGAELSPELFEMALSSSDLATVTLFVNQGLSIDAPFADGRSPLHVVVENSEPTDEEIVTLLVQRGTKINAKDRTGKTSLHLAAAGAYSNLTVVEKLVEMGADVSAKDAKGNTPLDYATKKEIRSYLKKAK